MARPRTVSDRDALDRARSCIVEHGPGVSLATLSRAVGLSPPALLKRFGSKEQLLFRAFLPTDPPRWRHTLTEPPGRDPATTLAEVLLELCSGFRSVGPAMAALRMSPVSVEQIFPVDQPGPAAFARRLMARWLETAGVPPPCDALADAIVGAAEARGFLTWVGPQLLDGSSDEAWAHQLAALALASRD